MKKFALFLLVLVMIFGFSSNVFATNWCDPKCPEDAEIFSFELEEVFDPELNIIPFHPFEGSFNLLDGGMGSENLVKNAILELYLTDDERDKLWDPNTWEFSQLTTWGGQLRIFLPFGVNEGEYEFNVTASVGDDLLLHYLVSSMGGDFGLAQADLYVDYCDLPGPDPIPEPATMILFGAGLLAIAGIGRKKLFKK